ncbi:MAG TPA: hypothetical protein VMV36_05920 [Ignavibacteriaceae bacterium]|nr:hypothetical protein [Ignavibacteriaceae bacterium]
MLKFAVDISENDVITVTDKSEERQIKICKKDVRELIELLSQYIEPSHFCEPSEYIISRRVLNYEIELQVNQMYNTEYIKHYMIGVRDGIKLIKEAK